MFKQSGCKKAEFEVFFKENYSQFYFLAFHMVEDEEISKDIVSDSFEYFWLHYKSSKIINWKAYMYSYIKNKCVDHIRHQAVKAKYAEFYWQMTSETVEEDLDEQEEIKQIYDILTKLTPQTRLILKECYINHKKYKEVANDLGVTPSAIKKHIVKALKRIREEIAKKNEKK